MVEMGSPSPAGERDVAAAASAAEETLRRLYRSLRWQVYLALGVAAAGLVGCGALVVLAPQEVLLFTLPLLLAVEFGCGFLVSGKLMALALARHHDRLRVELLAQQEQTKQALVRRWLALEPGQRQELRARFPDVDWSAIDGLAGTDGEAQTKH